MSFDDIAARYARDSKVQRGAGELLLAVAQVGPREDVLDVGCGTGALLARVRALTAGRVAGADPSAAMIEAARAHVPAGVELLRVAAEDLPWRAEFDLALSNSALQWFGDVPAALARVRQALRLGGRLAVQAPATSLYSPEFVEAIADVAKDPRTRETFSGFMSPWFFRETAAEYAALLGAAGFEVPLARIDEVSTRETAESALRVFGSGAEAGYLGAACYPAPLPAGYADTFREVVRASFARRAEADGTFELRFRRVFLVGVAR